MISNVSRSVHIGGCMHSIRSAASWWPGRGVCSGSSHRRPLAPASGTLPSQISCQKNVSPNFFFAALKVLRDGALLVLRPGGVPAGHGGGGRRAVHRVAGRSRRDGLHHVRGARLLPTGDRRQGRTQARRFFETRYFFFKKKRFTFFTERKRGERKSDGRLWTTCIDDCIIFAL